MKQFTCEICGMEFEAEEEENLILLVQRHMKNQHAMNRETDVSEPNLAYEEDEIRDKISEK